MAHRTDTWAAGDLYEPYVGRWSRKVAPAFLDWLQVAPHSKWLDLGCGTGALTAAILDRAEPASVLGIDASAGFIGHARNHIPDPRASFEIGDAQSLSLESRQFDAAVSALMLNFVPEPERAAGEMARVVRPGGMVAAYLWDYAGKMELVRYFWDAAIELNPAVTEIEARTRFPLCQPAPLEALFVQAGLRAVEVKPLEIAMPFRDFDDYWTPFLGGQGPAPGYAMSLSEVDRSRLRERLRATLPVQPDGSIALAARAWAVRGTAA